MCINLSINVLLLHFKQKHSSMWKKNVNLKLFLTQIMQHIITKTSFLNTPSDKGDKL